MCEGMKQSTQKVLTVILGVLSFPFFAAGIFNGREALVPEKQPELESFLAAAAAAEIPEEYPYEAVKAQVILVRSRCYVKEERGESTETVIRELVQEGKNAGASREESARCEQAVKETEDVVLKCGGKVVEGPFFRTGNGMTRSGKDIFQNDGYPWLVNVESTWDIDSENYLSSISFSAEELIRTLDEKEEAISEKMFGEEERNEILSGNVGVEQVAEQIQITATDTAGYVTELTVGNLKIAGETFRELLGLPSSCFSVQTLDGKIRFLCQGLGHGAGLSQTGAAAMAEEGKSTVEILQYYFPMAAAERK